MTMPRSTNGPTEKSRLVWLSNRLNSDLKARAGGLLESFCRKSGLRVGQISGFGSVGSAAHHHDLVCSLVSGESVKVEMKGSQGGKAWAKGVVRKPWADSVEFINLPWKNLGISQVYAKFWYQRYIPLVCAGYSLPTPPTESDWLRLDAAMGDAKSEFGKALKALVKSDPAVRKRMKELSNESLCVYWDSLKHGIASGAAEYTNLWDEFRASLEGEIARKLDEKDMWLVVRYEKESHVPLESRWFGKITLTDLECEIVSKRDYPVVKMCYSLHERDGPTHCFDGEARLRWGNRNGIANIRWNIT